MTLEQQRDRLRLELAELITQCALMARHVSVGQGVRIREAAQACERAQDLLKQTAAPTTKPADVLVALRESIESLGELKQHVPDMCGGAALEIHRARVALSQAIGLIEVVYGKVTPVYYGGAAGGGMTEGFLDK